MNDQELSPTRCDCRNDQGECGIHTPPTVFYYTIEDGQ